jgi:hypothetical protein
MAIEKINEGNASDKLNSLVTMETQVTTQCTFNSFRTKALGTSVSFSFINFLIFLIILSVQSRDSLVQRLATDWTAEGSEFESP